LIVFVETMQYHSQLLRTTFSTLLGPIRLLYGQFMSIGDESLTFGQTPIKVRNKVKW